MKLKGTKAKGSRAELEVRDELVADGYAVTKAGGSLGPFDIWALHTELQILRLIQVKSTSSKKKLNYASDVTRIKSMKVPFWAAKELWVRYRGAKWDRMVISK